MMSVTTPLSQSELDELRVLVEAQSEKPEYNVPPALLSKRMRDQFLRLLWEITIGRRIYCDKPEDRLWHAADRTWWRRTADDRLVRADPPEGWTDEGWQPIETAPRCPNEREHEERGLYTSNGDGLWYFKATHWREQA